MDTTRIILRFIFSTVIVLYLIVVVSFIFKNNMTGNYVGYLLFLTSLYIYFPAILLLIVLSIYSYLSKGVLWSLFKIEYYFLLASIGLFVLGSVVQATICPNCNL